jgi:predicted lipoprotein with Yx(FWY)xxD motif
MARHTTRVAAYGVAAAALATVLAACGSGSSGGSGGTQAVSPASGGNATLASKSTSIGTVATDANGHTVYELDGNSASNPKCASSACQAIWLPVMSGGSVMVLHGHPLFTFSGDSAAGQTNGQGVTDTWGTWEAVSPNGTPIEASGSGSTPSSAPSSSGGGGGYGY